MPLIEHIFNILCIDDNENNLYTLESILANTEDKCNIYKATSAKEGLEVLLNVQIDLILLDVQMPEVDGFETARLIKSNKRTKHIPIIFLTAIFKAEEFLQKGYKIGAIEYITKPIDDNQFLNKLNLYLKLLTKEKELRTVNNLLTKNIYALNEKTLYLDKILSSTSNIAIVGTDIDFKIKYFNPMAEVFSGLTASGAVGNNLITFLEKENVNIERFKQNVYNNNDYNVLIKKNWAGKLRYLDIKIVKIKEDSSNIAGYLIIAQDTTLQKEYEEALIRDIAEKEDMQKQLQNSLEEKELLLSEIHHRVKNNMQIICSLLNLQLDSIDDIHYKNMLKESQHRIKSMALVHEKLYQSENLSDIDFTDYIRQLINDLFNSYCIRRNKVRLQTNLKPVSLSIDSAIPCGLIVNEIISNTIKHAFPDDRTGIVDITLNTTEDGSINLIIKDNGVGFPENVSLETSETLGLQLIHSLATIQLQGHIDIYQQGGITYSLTFKDI
ncbi:MAG: response regulator [Candidatus Magnetoovum sp. WYHC-5]|nr:response regulator [Candidatus Magnetoovum sp. WYHC-5]